MKRSPKLISVCLFLIAAGGCIPEKRIVWSPDGSRAAVMTESGLSVIDAEGHVLPPRLAASSARCEWFADGRRLLVKHSAKGEKWNDILSLLSEKEAARIQTEAQALRERVLAYQGDWAQFDLDPGGRFAPGSEVAILLCLRDRFSEGLAEKLGTQWEDLAKAEAEITTVQVFTLTAAELQAGPILLRTLNPVSALRVSPSGQNIAFLMPLAEGTDHPPTLHVMSVEGGAARPVTPNTAANFDWSPDSRSIAFIHGNSTSHQSADNVQLGMLTTIIVADENGALLTEWGEQKDRIGLLFNDRLMVRWLSDGRLFFSSVEVTLPATTRDMPQQWSLFAYDPRMPAGVVRVLGRDFDGPLDAGLPLFFLSPDEKRVLLPGPKGSLTLYEIATGTSTSVTGSDERDDKLRSLPSWRNNSEICFVGPEAVQGGAAAQLQVMLWKDGQTRSLSNTWTAEMREGWMTPTTSK